MMTNNLALWNSLKKTDPRATKAFTRSGGFRGTQIDPTWRMQMMTEAFGPVGKGWGYEQLEWTIAERMVFICCRVWYVRDGEKCFTGPQWGGTELVRRRRDGNEVPDDEAFKMSITDAIGKCCLQIGLAADIYMGQFDDSKYRDEVNAEYRAKENGKAETKPAPKTNGAQKFELIDPKGKVVETFDRAGLFLQALMARMNTEDPVQWWAINGSLAKHIAEKAPQAKADVEAMEQTAIGAAA